MSIKKILGWIIIVLLIGVVFGSLTYAYGFWSMIKGLAISVTGTGLFVLAVYWITGKQEKTNNE